MKKLILVDIDVKTLKEKYFDSTNSETFDVDDAIRNEMQWVNSSGIFAEDVIETNELANEDSWLNDAKYEERFDKKSELIKLVATIMEDDFTNFHCDKDILYDLLRNTSTKSLIEYLPEDGQDKFIK